MIGRKFLSGVLTIKSSVLTVMYSWQQVVQISPVRERRKI